MGLDARRAALTEYSDDEIARRAGGVDVVAVDVVVGRRGCLRRDGITETRSYASKEGV